jgi:hypothetical protein
MAVWRMVRAARKCALITMKVMVLFVRSVDQNCLAIISVSSTVALDADTTTMLMMLRAAITTAGLTRGAGGAALAFLRGADFAFAMMSPKRRARPLCAI